MLNRVRSTAAGAAALTGVGPRGESLSGAHLHTLGSLHRNSSTRSATIRTALVTWTSTGKSLVWAVYLTAGPSLRRR